MTLQQSYQFFYTGTSVQPIEFTNKNRSLSHYFDEFRLFRNALLTVLTLGTLLCTYFCSAPFLHRSEIAYNMV